MLDSESYPETKMDFVLDGNLAHCIVGRDRETLFDNVQNVIQPGGYFLVRHVLSPVDERLPSPYTFDPESHLLHYGNVPYRFLPTFEMLHAELEASGFRILDSELTYDLNAKRGFQHGIVETMPS